MWSSIELLFLPKIENYCHFCNAIKCQICLNKFVSSLSILQRNKIVKYLRKLEHFQFNYSKPAMLFISEERPQWLLDL